MGVSNEAKNVIPLKFSRKIKKKKVSSCEVNPGTYGRVFLAENCSTYLHTVNVYLYKTRHKYDNETLKIKKDLFLRSRKM
jgi:hypothetical protein